MKPYSQDEWFGERVNMKDKCPLCNRKKDSRLLVCPDCQKELLETARHATIERPPASVQKTFTAFGNLLWN